MATGDEVWKPGSFTKNFSWGPRSNGLLKLHESIRIGFAETMADVSRAEFRDRVSGHGHSEFIPINFFLFNRPESGDDVIVADELVYQALSAPHSANFDKLALFALNFSYVGRWTGAEATQRRPALWASHYIRDKVAADYDWRTSLVNAADIQGFVEGDARYSAKSAKKLSTNLNYLYEIGDLASFASTRVDRWWVDALFLAMDRLIEDRALDGRRILEKDYEDSLTSAGFQEISGNKSLEKELASTHLVTLYTECGGRGRFSDEHVKERTELRIPDLAPFAWPNHNEAIGAIHPTNPRILKSIPRVCAMLAKYAGFDTIDADELAAFDLDDFVRRHTQAAIDRIRQEGIVPTMTAEEFMKISRDR